MKDKKLREFFGPIGSAIGAFIGSTIFSIIILVELPDSFYLEKIVTFLFLTFFLLLFLPCLLNTCIHDRVFLIFSAGGIGGSIGVFISSSLFFMFFLFADNFGRAFCYSVHIFILVNSISAFFFARYMCRKAEDKW